MEKNLIMVVAPKDFQDEEYTESKSILVASGACVKTASSTPEEAIGVCNSHVEVDTAFYSINPEDHDGLIFIGGIGVKQYFNDVDVLNLIRKFSSQGKLLAAIGWAPELLARAGVLANKRATIWNGNKSALTSRNISYTGEEITVDGNVITAADSSYACRFGSEIVKYFGD